MLVFLTIALLTLVCAAAAMSLRNLVHCALMAALTFAGLAALYLHLGAQFVGFAQILVYVGAVAILIVFAILLTQGSEPPQESIVSRTWWAGVAVAGLVWMSLTAAVVLSPVDQLAAGGGDASRDAATVQNIGASLMTTYVLPLEILALLLTAATIGAVIVAMHEHDSQP